MLMGGSEDPQIQQGFTKSNEQRSLINRLAKVLDLQLGDEQNPTGIGVPAYEGSLTAGPSGLEQKSWGVLDNLLGGGIQGSQQTNQDAISRIMDGTGEVPKYDVGQFDPKAIQDWFQGALVNPAMRTWEDQVVPTIQEKFIGQNAGSSGAANRAISGSASDLMAQLNSLFADKLMGEKQAFDTREFQAGTQDVQNQINVGQNDLQRILNVPGMGSTDTQSMINAILTGQQAGATQRGIEQQGLSEAFQKWLYSQPYANPWLSQFLNPAVSATSNENIVFPGTQSQGLFQTMLAPIMSSYAGSDKGSSQIAGMFGG